MKHLGVKTANTVPCMGNAKMLWRAHRVVRTMYIMSQRACYLPLCESRSGWCSVLRFGVGGGASTAQYLPLGASVRRALNWDLKEECDSKYEGGTHASAAIATVAVDMTGFSEVGHDAWVFCAAYCTQEERRYTQQPVFTCYVALTECLSLSTVEPERASEFCDCAC